VDPSFHPTASFRLFPTSSFQRFRTLQRGRFPGSRRPPLSFAIALLCRFCDFFSFPISAILLARATFTQRILMTPQRGSLSSGLWRSGIALYRQRVFSDLFLGLPALTSLLLPFRCARGMPRILACRAEHDPSAGPTSS